MLKMAPVPIGFGGGGRGMFRKGDIKSPVGGPIRNRRDLALPTPLTGEQGHIRRVTQQVSGGHGRRPRTLEFYTESEGSGQRSLAPP